jgi:hypothetical protein
VEKEKGPLIRIESERWGLTKKGAAWKAIKRKYPNAKRSQWVWKNGQWYYSGKKK